RQRFCGFQFIRLQHARPDLEEPFRSRRSASASARYRSPRVCRRTVSFAHSVRSASIGLTVVARCAGIQHATAAPASSSRAAAANVTGSCGGTPYNWFCSRRAAIDAAASPAARSEEHTSELQSLAYLVCRLLLEKKNQRRLGKLGCVA